MVGSIYSDEKCPICGGAYRYEERRNGLFCVKHPDQKAPGKFRVRFGKKLKKRFGDDYVAAERFLTGIRYETDRGTFDIRDYKSDNPLGVTTLAEKWLAIKEQTVKYGSFKGLRCYMHKAMDAWGQRNIKSVQYADIEDFFNEQTSISKKTLHNMRSCLNQFFDWVESRESQFKKPELPEVKFTLGMRNIVSKSVQTSILEEVKRIAPFKVWLGVRWLSIYVKMRPVEMIRIKERDLVDGMLFLRPETTKEKKPKFVPLLQEDIDLLATSPKGFPEQFLFRHEKGAGQAKPGSQYGPRYLYKWWIKACGNLGIKGVDLYGGTRHSSVTALSQHFSAEEIKEHGTGHDTSKAFERYFQAEAKISRVIYEAANASPKHEKLSKKVVSLKEYR